MTKNTTINLRVNSDIKAEAGETLASMGLTFSDAFNLLLHQVKIQRRLPFDVVSYSHIPRPETLALIERIENGEADMVGPFTTFEEYKASLYDGEDDEDDDDEV